MNTETEPTEPQVKPTPKKRARLWRHALVMAVELCIVGFVVGVVGFAALIWRLQSGTLDASRVSRPIAAILSGVVGLDRIDLESPALAWDKDHLALQLNFASVQLYTKDGALSAMRDVHVSMSAVRLIFGRLYFENVSIGEMGLRIVRTEDGRIGFSNTNADTKAAPTTPDMRRVAHTLNMLGEAEVKKATLVLNTTATPSVLSDVRMHFAKKTLLMEFGQNVDPLTGADRMAIAYQYDRKADVLHLAAAMPRAQTAPLLATIKDAFDVPQMDVTLAGEASLALARDGKVTEFSLHMTGSEGTFAWANKDIPAYPIRRIVLDGGLDLAKHRLVVKEAGFMLKGIEISLAADFTQAAKDKPWTGTLIAKSPVIAADAIDPLWPKSLAPQTRDWVVSRMKNGRFAGITATVPLTATQSKSGWHVAANDRDVAATFRYTDVSVDYHDTLLDVHKVTGSGEYKNLALNLDINSAAIDALKVKSGHLYIDDLVTAGTGTATLDLHVVGPLKDLASYLSVEPVNLHTRSELLLRQAQGMGDYQAKVIFPITHDAKVEDVKVSATATLTNIDIPNTLRGLNLSGGPYHLDIKDDTLAFDGKGAIGGQPITLKLTQSLLSTDKPTNQSMNLTADVDTSDSGRAPFLGKIAKQVKGMVPVHLTYVSTFDGKGDLAGTLNMDKAMIDFAPFGYTKQAGQNADGSFKADLTHGVLTKLHDITVKGTGLAASNVTLLFDTSGTVTSASLPSVTVGETRGSLTYGYAGGAETVVFKGAGFDARGRDSGAGDGSSKGMDLSITADKLWLSDMPLTGANLTYKKNASGQMTALSLNGRTPKAPVSVSYTYGGSFHLQSDDAGTALQALDITTRVRGGTIAIDAKPTGQGGDVTGALVIKNFAARDVPALAKLINLLSLQGLLSLLSNDTGLAFARLESNFTWLNHPHSSVYQFSDGRTSGSSLGLTFEGDVNETAHAMNLKGTVIPMSEVNTLLDNIPLIGQLLTGGGKGIFAATYTMTGAASDPSVSVNPLSVLAPGLIRRILFEGK